MFNQAALLGTAQSSVAVGNRSVSLASASSQYLSMSDSNFGSYDRTKFAYSVWWKRTNTTVGTYYLMSQIDAAATDRAWRVFLNSSHKINFNTSANGTSTNGNLITTATYANTNWHHLLVWYDSGNATAGDRMRMWIDGTEITAFDTDTNPNATVHDSAAPIAVGSNSADTTGASYWNGLLFQNAFYSGVLPDISTLYNAGSPVAISRTGLKSLLNEDSANAVTVDTILSTGWTNNNTAVQSSTVPP